MSLFGESETVRDVLASQRAYSTPWFQTVPTPVRPAGEVTARQAAIRELGYALEALQSDFNGKSGPSGLRAEAMAHVRKAILWLTPDDTGGLDSRVIQTESVPIIDANHAARVLAIYARADVQDSLWWTVRDGHIRFLAPCNDLFWWGTADGEAITPENVEVLDQTERDLRALEKTTGGSEMAYLSELFAARVRHMRPQRACYKNFPPGLAALFDACGPERDPKDEG